MCSRYLDNSNRHHTAANASWSRWWSAFQGCLGVYEWACTLLSCNLSPFLTNRHFDVTNGFIPLHSSSDHSTRPFFSNSASQHQNIFLPWPNSSPHLEKSPPLSKDMIQSSKTCSILFCHPKKIHLLVYLIHYLSLKERLTQNKNLLKIYAPSGYQRFTVDELVCSSGQI